MPEIASDALVQLFLQSHHRILTPGLTERPIHWGSYRFVGPAGSNGTIKSSTHPWLRPRHPWMKNLHEWGATSVVTRSGCPDSSIKWRNIRSSTHDFFKLIVIWLQDRNLSYCRSTVRDLVMFCYIHSPSLLYLSISYRAQSYSQSCLRLIDFLLN